MKKVTFLVILFICLTINKLSFADSNDKPKYIAFIGDSAMTGAVSHPEMRMDLVGLLGRINYSIFRFFDVKLNFHKLPIELETRLSYTNKYYDIKEFNLNDVNNISKRLPWENDTEVEKIAFELLDYPFYAWTNLIGSYFQYHNGQKLLIAQDGRRTDTFSEQVSVLFNYVEKNYPEKIFVQFTGNDICTRKIFKKNDEQLYNRLYKPLMEGFEEIIASYKDKENKVQSQKSIKSPIKVYIMPFTDITQMISSPKVLATKVPFVIFPEVSCYDIRSKLKYNKRVRTATDTAGQTLISRINNMCSSILETEPDQEDRINHLKNIIDIFRNAQEDATKAAQEKIESSKIKFVYLKGMEKFQFETGDVANDCFHPSIKGHYRIATSVIEVLKAMDEDSAK